MVRKSTIGPVVAGLLLAFHATARAETLGDGWPWRRPVTFKQVASDAPGENIAWVEFYANGTQKADGSDIRVTSADRILMPHKIMQVSRENDVVRVAFATKGDGPYFVWWGNPKADKPAKELEIHRGIELEVSHNATAGAAAINVPQGPVMASYLLPEVGLGFNPFGEERQIMLHYSAMFKIDRAITAQFAFTVNDMGILNIDGKEVNRQIKTGLKGQVLNSVPVDLAAGWHTLDVKQVNQNAGNVVMALAWQRPGEKTFTSFPSSIVPQAARGVAGTLEKVGSPLLADISVDSAAEGFLPPTFYGQRYVFDAQFPGNMKPTISWDFGDGQTYKGLKKISHIFLAPGVYPVTLKLETTGAAAEGLTSMVRLWVRDRMYEKFPRPVEDPAPTVRSVLHDYKPELLPPEQAFRGMMFFESTGDDDDQVAWGRAWLAGKEKILPTESVVFEETYALARLLVGRKQFPEAAESFKLAAVKPLAMEMRANLMRHEVMTLCDYVDDADTAQKEAQAWLKKIVTTNKMQVQTVQVALAYAAIASGDGKAAKGAVDAALAARGQPAANGGGHAYNQKQIRTGVLTRNVENYIRTKDLDTALTLLNQWELEFPDALWEGFTRTLRVKLAAEEGRNLVAARMALAHARANPDGFYAAELLYRAAENFKLGGEQQQAKTVMDLLAGKYPESPYAREALSK